MHTVEQASTLWCPMARVGVLPSSGGPSAVNDPDTEVFRSNCIGDKCAMWRWGPENVIPAYKRQPISFYRPRPIAETRAGYCGLAPQR